MRSKLCLVICLFIITSCKNSQDTKEHLILMLRSGNKDSIINAASIISEIKDTSMISYLLENAADPRISHRLNYKGMSVYQIKMNTIKSLTGISPEVEITYKPDSTVIGFYNRLYK